MMNEKELPVYAALDRMGIEYTRIEHPAAATMEACAAIGEGTGASHCKNLFLTNRQGTAFFLLCSAAAKIPNRIGQQTARRCKAEFHNSGTARKHTRTHPRFRDGHGTS